MTLHPKQPTICWCLATWRGHRLILKALSQAMAHTILLVQHARARKWKGTNPRQQLLFSKRGPTWVEEVYVDSKSWSMLLQSIHLDSWSLLCSHCDTLCVCLYIIVSIFFHFVPNHHQSLPQKPSTIPNMPWLCVRKLLLGKVIAAAEAHESSTTQWAPWAVSCVKMAFTLSRSKKPVFEPQTSGKPKVPPCSRQFVHFPCDWIWIKDDIRLQSKSNRHLCSAHFSQEGFCSLKLIPLFLKWAVIRKMVIPSTGLTRMGSKPPEEHVAWAETSGHGKYLPAGSHLAHGTLPSTHIHCQLWVYDAARLAADVWTCETWDQTLTSGSCSR